MSRTQRYSRRTSCSASDNSELKHAVLDLSISWNLLFRRVSPVEQMFAAWPAYLYLNSTLCGAMLSPLLESQDTSPGPWFAAADLGTFPFPCELTES